MTWKLVFTRQAQKDAKKLADSGLKLKAQELLALIAENPYRKPPPFEKPIGDLAGAYFLIVTVGPASSVKAACRIRGRSGELPARARPRSKLVP